MADSKLVDLAELTTIASGDLFYVVDISDTTDGVNGTNKKITQTNFLGSIQVTDLGVTGLTVSELLRVNAGGTAVESSGKTVPTGDIVGTTDTQTLTNKTIDGDDNTLSDIAVSSTKLVAGTGLTLSTDTINGDTASTTAVGVIEVATAAETTTGTDATRAVSPDGLAGSDYGKRVVNMVLLDDTTDNATGDGQGDITFTVPEEMNNWNLVGAHAAVEVAGTTSTQDIQIHNVTQAVDMLSTKITIDTTELTSYTAATPPVIDTANDDVATGDKIRVDTDQVHSGTAAKGLQVILTFQLP